MWLCVFDRIYANAGLTSELEISMESNFFVLRHATTLSNHINGVQTSGWNPIGCRDEEVVKGNGLPTRPAPGPETDAACW